MGLFNKIKNVLFEEEEIEIPVFTKEEKKEEIKPIKRTVETSKREPLKTEVKEVVKKKEVQEDNERETFKAEPTFQFPVFDEKEFNEPKKTRSNRNNGLDKEKKSNKKIDFGRFDSKPKVQEEKKKFTPSPVISPVYGVLDKNYNKTDFKKKQEEKKTKVIDVDSIRKKAYGTLEEEIENTFNKPVKEFYEEKPAKTINELLIDAVDEEIDVEDINLEEEKEVQENNSLDVLDEIEADIKESKKNNLEDTLESDLFNLIDSMYTDREDEK